MISNVQFEHLRYNNYTPITRGFYPIQGGRSLRPWVQWKAEERKKSKGVLRALDVLAASVCLFVCLCVCLFVNTKTSERVNIGRWHLKG